MLYSNITLPTPQAGVYWVMDTPANGVKGSTTNCEEVIVDAVNPVPETVIKLPPDVEAGDKSTYITIYTLVVLAAPSVKANDPLYAAVRKVRLPEAPKDGLDRNPVPVHVNITVKAPIVLSGNV
jgi:hypothetical protein